MQGDIAFQANVGYRKCCHECSLGVYLVIDNMVYVPSDAFPLYQKAIGQFVMEIQGALTMCGPYLLNI